MKKLVFGLVATVMFGCIGNAQEGKENDKRVNVEKLTNDLLDINKGYVQDYQKRSFKSWCQIGVADVGGAWAGCWAGGKIGSLFGPQGAAIGSGVGAVVVGAAASYGASRMASTGLNPKLLDERILSYDSSITFSNPNQNPFDISCGKRHNELLVSLLKNNNAEESTDLNNIYINIKLNDNEILFYKEKIDATIGFYSMFKNSDDIVETFKNLIDINVTDSILHKIMNNYIDGVHATGNLDDAIKLTNEYEAYIILNEEISEEQRATLLMGFSVARYSFNFWN
ncbi:hypothetical protein [Flavobacterium sp.]|jgi:hypothetical protein|uniref:hypothetical protein n=1 Tax=Flavobacterium sp. TaxID=239 RepID=UPI0037BE2E7D